MLGSRQSFCALVLLSLVMSALIAPAAAFSNMVKVPDVVGLHLDEAKTALGDANLTAGIIHTIESDLIPKNRVVEQHPAAGTLIPENEAVEIYNLLFQRDVFDLIQLWHLRQLFF